MTHLCNFYQKPTSKTGWLLFITMNDIPIGAGKSSFDLIDSQKLFSELKLKEGITFLDVACGNGNYSIAASKYIGNKGTIYAFDLWKEGIDNLLNQIAIQKIQNIHAKVADVSKEISVEKSSVDICLMATVLHDLIQDHTDAGTLNEIKRVLKTKGTLAIVEFKKIEGPPGPPIEIRLSPEELEKIVTSYRFQCVKTTDIGQYNYLSIFMKQKDK